jgi:RNA polymerase sigma factor (sigma-70 family)
MRGDHEAHLAQASAAVVAVGRRWVHDPHTREDVTQEAITRLIAASERVKPADWPPYARTITLNIIRTAHRSAGYEATKLERIAAWEPGPVPPADEPLTPAETRQLRQALAVLTAADRALLLDLYVNEHSISDVAARCAVTPLALRVRAHRARARLRANYLADQADRSSTDGDGGRSA